MYDFIQKPPSPSLSSHRTYTAYSASGVHVRCSPAKGKNGSDDPACEKPIAISFQPFDPSFGLYRVEGEAAGSGEIDFVASAGNSADQSLVPFSSLRLSDRILAVTVVLGHFADLG